MGPQKSQTRLSTQAQWILQDRGLWALTSAKSQENQDKLVTLLSDPHSNRFYNPHFTGKETEAQRVMSFTQDHGDRWATQLALEVKNLPANAGNIRDRGSIPGSGRCLEEGMASHSSVLAWRIPWAEEPGGLQSTASLRVRHD